MILAELARIARKKAELLARMIRYASFHLTTADGL
jgi:hypothetical protein